MNSFELFGIKIDKNSRLYYVGNDFDYGYEIFKKRRKIISTKLAGEKERIRTVKIYDGRLHVYDLNGGHRGVFDIISEIEKIERLYNVINDINPKELLLNKIKI